MKNFSQEEAKVIYNDAKKKGLNPDKVMAQLVLKGVTFDGIDMEKAKQYAESQVPQTKTTFNNIKEDLKTDLNNRVNRYGEIQQREDTPLIERTVQKIGQGAGLAANAIEKTAELIPGVKKVGEKIGEGINWLATSDYSPIKHLGDAIGNSKKLQEATQLYETDENFRDTVDGVANLVRLGLDVDGVVNSAQFAKNVTQKLATGTKNIVGGIGDGASGAMQSINDSGVGQIASDLVERIPRAIKRGQENLAENAIRAEKIRTSTPSVKQAIKSNLDERIINTVTEADDATKQAYQQVVDIAEETPKTVGLKKQPSIVGGELASKQYDIISKQKKSVGEKIGELTKNLSKTERLSMQDSFGQIDDTLSLQGIVPQYTKKGVKLDFTGSKYTPAERTKIQELYNLATEGGDTLSPSQIKGKDQLFSKLKRESNFEGIGDLIIETPEGNKSLFNIFRDIYSSKLDTISPEIRDLNAQYRKLSNIIDDIEDSIFKTPNFNVTKSVDPAEFAKVNLRRIFGEAQSSPTYQAIADLMDKSARELGYKGTTPKQVAEFAEYIRKLYPESVPKTGFQGGIKAGISDVIETVSKIGTPDIIDQRKALRALLKNLSN